MQRCFVLESNKNVFTHKKRQLRNHAKSWKFLKFFLKITQKHDIFGILRQLHHFRLTKIRLQLGILLFNPHFWRKREVANFDLEVCMKLRLVSITPISKKLWGKESIHIRLEDQTHPRKYSPRESQSAK